MGSLEAKLTKMFLKERLEEWLGADDENLERAVESLVRKGSLRLYYNSSKDDAIGVKGSSIDRTKKGEPGPGSEPFRYHSYSGKEEVVAETLRAE